MHPIKRSETPGPTLWFELILIACAALLLAAAVLMAFL
jgi:hypothetical protein